MLKISRLSLIAPLLLLAGCGGGGAPKVHDAWVRLPAVPGQPAAGYFTLVGGAKDDQLVSAESPSAKRIELHSNMMHGGMMQMRPLEKVALAAGGKISFAPGGNHAMLFDVSNDVKPGGTLLLKLRLASGATAEAPAKVIAAGDTPPQD